MNATLGNAGSVAPSADERLRVLIVEDHPLVRRVLRLALHRAGFAVVSASTGEEAIRKHASGGEPVHLVITDGVMTGMDGFDVARYFARQDPAVRVIIISGYLNHFTARPDIPENVDAFFGKPFASQDLVAKVRELLGVVA